MKKKIEDIYCITSNKNKLLEIEAILLMKIKRSEIPLDEIQSLNIEKIIKKKAEHAYAIIEKPVIVDDVGLYIDAWNGFPGPFVKFLVHENGNKILLKMLASERNRKAVLKAAIGFHDGENIHTFISEIEGKISQKERGTGGWGIDPIFIPKGQVKTFAQMGLEKKNSISHRKVALEKFKSFFTRNYDV